MTAGLYWRTLSQSSSIAVGLATEHYELGQPRDRIATRLGTSEPSMPDVQKAMTALRAYLDAGASEVRLSATDLTFAGDANADFLTRILAPMRDVVSTAMTSDASTDPVAKMISLGHGLLAGAEASIAAGAVASAAGTNVVTGSFGADGIVSWLQPFARLLIYAIAAAGVALAYILPVLPAIFMIFLAIGWLVFVLEAKIAILVWSFLWCRMDGTDLVSDVQKPGATLLFNIALRPTFGILALCGSYALMSLVLGFVDQTFGLAFAGSQGSHVVGLVGLVVGVCTLTYVEWKILIRLLELIAEMPDKIARWFGHGGEHLGEAHAGATIVAGSLGGTTTALQRAAPAPRPTLPVRPSPDPSTGTGGGRSPGPIGGAGRPSGSA
jgi:conjugal transfer/type IV secretion protein DotA/TraY